MKIALPDATGRLTDYPLKGQPLPVSPLAADPARTVLVASTRGDTGVQAAQQFQGYDVIVVTHSTGFREPNTQELTEENRAAIDLRKALDNDPERKQKILSRTPMNRFGTAEEIGNAAVYLCSPAAQFVTGVVLPVDGGASIGFWSPRFSTTSSAASA